MDIESIADTTVWDNPCPFTLPSGEAEGEWFVGRRVILDLMVKSVISSDGRLCNYHLHGLPRIGKTSLLKAFKADPRVKAKCGSVMMAYLSFDHFTTPQEMWTGIREVVLDSLDDFAEDPRYPELQERIERALSRKGLDDFSQLKQMMTRIRKAGFRTLLLIDEFDNFTTIVKQDGKAAGQFRTLINESDYGVSAVVASRRTIKRIEAELTELLNANVSNLDGILGEGCFIRPFDEHEMQEYWQAVERRSGAPVSDVYRRSVEYYAGSHPMLLNLLNHRYWARQRSNGYLCDPDHEFKPSDDDMLALEKVFDDAIWRVICGWGLDKEALSLTWGWSMENVAASGDLLRYGAIDDSPLSVPGGPNCIAVSRYFTDWIRDERYKMDYDKIFGLAETNMRMIVHDYCDKMYGGNEERMIQSVINAAPRYERYVTKGYDACSRFEEMRRNRDKNKRKFPDMPDSIIDFSHPSDLPEVFYRRDWGWFGQIFHGTWDEWKVKFSLMVDIRNPGAHHNPGVPKQRIELAKECCNEVILCIEHYMAGKK